jgi:DNA-directed RNA polymerase specialized sigma24 family protein
VFRHWGLPYSGRIAKLAEAGIADARAGRAVGGGSWPVFRAALAAVPAEHQVCLVATCVEGLGDDALAEVWGCDTAAAGARRAETLAHMKELAVRCGDDRAVVTVVTEKDR